MPAVEVESRKVLSAKHVGELLGKSSRTIRRWSQTGEHGFPPPFVTAGHPRWRSRDVMKWLAER